MTYPDKLLAPGETVAFELKPHWRALIAPAIVLVIEVFVASWLFFSISVSWLRWVIVIAVIVITIWKRSALFYHLLGKMFMHRGPHFAGLEKWRN